MLTYIEADMNYNAKVIFLAITARIPESWKPPRFLLFETRMFFDIARAKLGAFDAAYYYVRVVHSVNTQLLRLRYESKD